MKKARGITTGLFLAIGVTALLTAAETKAPDSDHDSLKQATEKFMAAISKGQTKEAFDGLLKSYWFKKDEAAATAESQASQYDAGQNTLELRIGKRVPGGYEFLGTRRLGKSLLRFAYVQKHEQAVFPWVFVFYRADNEWKLLGIVVADAAQEDLNHLVVSEPAK